MRHIAGPTNMIRVVTFIIFPLYHELWWKLHFVVICSYMLSHESPCNWAGIALVNIGGFTLRSVAAERERCLREFSFGVLAVWLCRAVPMLRPLYFCRLRNVAGPLVETPT